MKLSFLKQKATSRENNGTDRENAQSSPWDMGIPPKLFLDQLNA